jgi:hypothetical protein
MAKTRRETPSPPRSGSSTPVSSAGRPRFSSSRTTAPTLSASATAARSPGSILGCVTCTETSVGSPTTRRCPARTAAFRAHSSAACSPRDTSSHTVAVTGASRNSCAGSESRPNLASTSSGPPSAARKASDKGQLAVQVFHAVAHQGYPALPPLVDHAAVGQAGHLGRGTQADLVALVQSDGEVQAVGAVAAGRAQR